MTGNRGKSDDQAVSKAESVIRLYWIDWLTECAPHFDIQEMIDFCSIQLGGRGAVQIKNALGRLGRDQAAEDDAVARKAIISFAFAIESDREAFAHAFSDVIADHAMPDCFAKLPFPYRQIPAD
jgi:hypothetical protein